MVSIWRRNATNHVRDTFNGRRNGVATISLVHRKSYVPIGPSAIRSLMASALLW